MNIKINIENQAVTLNFENVEVKFGEEEENVFRRFSKKTLKEILLDKNYEDLKDQGFADNPKYRDSLNEPLGSFLKRLKDKKDQTYRNFLLWADDVDELGKTTRCCVGDLQYIKYWITKSEKSQQVGLYIYCVDQKVRYIGVCERKKRKNDFFTRINNGYGNISPRNTLRKGQASNCRVNAKVRKNRNGISIWICPLNQELPLKKYENALIKKFSSEGIPLWNTKL